MYPVTMQTISAERGREMRQQAAAWRRARRPAVPHRHGPPESVRTHRAERTVLGGAQAPAGPGSRLRMGGGAAHARRQISQGVRAAREQAIIRYVDGKRGQG